ncbi:MAG: recombinase family protein, partial [Deltaproteobacteria bacterium]|nr:recombinase family protein [Deltaproteobacteria bacterium]
MVVWKLDRLGRSLRDLIDVVTRLGQRGVALRSLHESIDTATPAGKLTFHVFAALSEFECDVLHERTRAGLAAARTRGARLGCPRALTPEQIEMARTLLANPNLAAR